MTGSVSSALFSKNDCLSVSLFLFLDTSAKLFVSLIVSHLVCNNCYVIVLLALQFIKIKHNFYELST